MSTLCPIFLQSPSLMEYSLQGYSLLTTPIRYDTYFVRDKMEKLDFQLRDKAIKLRGLETITYKGTEPQPGMLPRDRESLSLASGSRAVPTMKSSQLQDLEIRLPERYFQTGVDPGINRSASIKPDKFLDFMSHLLDQRLRWLWRVENVKQVQHLRSDIRMGCCLLLLLWDSNRNADEEANKRPWIFLRDMDTELGRARWWCGQGKIQSFLISSRYHR